MAGKIAELKFEAPLARFEEEDTASLKNMNLLTGAKQPPCYSFSLPLPFPASCVLSDAGLGTAMYSTYSAQQCLSAVCQLC